jgi:hypothetical protein
MPTFFCAILLLIPLCALLFRVRSILLEKEDRFFYAWQALRDITGTTVTFTLIGPPLGLLVALSPSLVFGLINPSALLIFLIYCLAVGVIPASLPGITVGALLPWLRGESGPLLSAAVGAVIATAFFIAAEFKQNGLRPLLPAACGGSAGLILGWRCLRERT